MAEDEPGTQSFGICWECCGIPSSCFFETLPTGSQVTKKILLFNGAWERIGLDCALCSSLKAYLLDSGFIGEPNSESAESIMGGASEKDYPLAAIWSRYLMDRRGENVPLYEFYALAGDETRTTWFCSASAARHIPAELRDLTFARNWVSKCVRLHELSCGHNRSSTTSLTVIDCASRNLCEIIPGTTYVCLSYVWGNSCVTEDHSKKVPAVMPKTIEDAMYVTLQLGISYLWVDRYCISQKTAAEKHRLITNMDAIYGGATLTIIAAAGGGPDHGLPGINGTPRRQRYSRVVKSTGQEIVSIDVSREIQTSTWNTRGWTYQEMVLSRRRLVFTATQMYFQCNAVSDMETFSSNDPACPDRISDTVQLPPYLTAFSYPRAASTTEYLYKQLIEYYERCLSFDEDIIKAFLGIINAFEMQHGSDHIYATHIYGLPVFYNQRSPSFSLPSANGASFVTVTPKSTFLHSLTWHIYPATKSIYDVLTDTALYPSWSFASVKVRSKSGRPRALWIQPDLEVYGHQEDVHVWVKDTKGTSFDLDQYIFARSQRDDIDLLPAISIMSWVVTCQIECRSPGSLHCFDYSISGFRAGRSPVLDYGYAEDRYSNTLVAMYIESFQYLAKSRSATLLLLEEVNDLTWRRVGLFEIEQVEVDPNIDTPTFLNSLRKDGQWEMRTLCLV
ncbi:hypothetical protein HBI56_128550 [Parastagonospora nodorum]|nr:hypothetical protein HBH53_176770 [Parastagonospora nodorum]KAH4080245.1 hypothetical protein HBH46_231620 [Parastagonospora nodorum]KAH4287715.1 hypothetical protein HBI02_214690 [Parastagonospora nodorum]KAH4288812.1 hypothetical protein HBI01_217460 [Parastagonospora nodorum]KAH4320673.1 hypothetical protein HBI00_222560 [Parastagonospora nodorum]